jgi:hypothetical protein
MRTLVLADVSNSSSCLRILSKRLLSWPLFRVLRLTHSPLTLRRPYAMPPYRKKQRRAQKEDDSIGDEKSARDEAIRELATVYRKVRSLPL